MFNIPTYLIEQQVLATAATTITFDVATLVAAMNVSWTPRHLLVRVNGRSDRASTRDTTVLQFNGDTGANYNVQFVHSDTTATAVRQSDQTEMPSTAGVADSADANVFGGGMILIPDALSTRSHKSIVALSGAVEAQSIVLAGRWASTAAITSILLQPQVGTNFMTGSTFDLCVVDESFNHTEEII